MVQPGNKEQANLLEWICAAKFYIRKIHAGKLNGLASQNTSEGDEQAEQQQPSGATDVIPKKTCPYHLPPANLLCVDLSSKYGTTSKQRQ